MSDLLNPVFKDSDDEFLSYGDEELPQEDLEEGEEPEGAEGQPADQTTPDKILFTVTGEDGKEQQLPLGKLTPAQVKDWYDAHANKHEWNKSNTEKATQLANERREYEAQKQQFDALHQQTEQWVNYFRSSPGLQQLVTAFIQGRIPQQIQQQILGQQVGQQPAGVQPGQQYDSYLNNVVQRLAALEQQLQRERESRMQDRQLSEREKAMQGVLPLIPEGQREAFKQYLDQATTNVTDLPSMYKLMADAFQWSNKDALIKEAQAQALAAQKKKQGAGVETGERSSAVNLPQNIDVSGTRDIQRIYEEGLEKGLLE